MASFLGDLHFTTLPSSKIQARVHLVVWVVNKAPETGELINGVSSIYGKSCFDSVGAAVMDYVDLRRPANERGRSATVL